MDQFNGKKYLHRTDLTVKEARKTLFKSIGGGSIRGGRWNSTALGGGRGKGQEDF